MTTFLHWSAPDQNGDLVVPRKQRETGFVVLVGFQQCEKFPLVRFLYAVQVKFDSFFRNLEAFGKLTTDLSVALLQFRFQGFIIQRL